MFDFVPAAEVDAIVSADADPLLQAAGFARVRRRWVRARPPIRHVFELESLKGATRSPRWGISFDFVPHLKGSTLAWHRTDKSALLDLVYDPIDFDPDWERAWGIATLHGAEALRRRTQVVIPRAVSAAVAWLDRVRDAPTALVCAESLRSTKAIRFGFDNYVQAPLAYAFLLARTGSTDAARRVLDEWIDRPEREAHRERLSALLSQ